MRGTYSLVIFDCDGVLIDSEPIGNRVFAEIVTEVGWPTTEAECHKRFRGMSVETAMRLIEAEIGRPLPPGWADEVWARSRKAFEVGVDAIPGVGDVVQAVVDADIATCVASSSEFDHIDVNLARAGLRHHFGDRIFNAAMVARGKPAPDLFLHAAAEMGHAPDGCIVVEDSLAGVQAGVAAGMRVFGYVGDPHTDGTALTRAGAHVFDDMRALPGLLGLSVRT